MSALDTESATMSADAEHGELSWLDHPTCAELAWLDTLKRRVVSPAKTDVDSSGGPGAPHALLDVRLQKHR